MKLLPILTICILTIPVATACREDHETPRNVPKLPGEAAPMPANPHGQNSPNDVIPAVPPPGADDLDPKKVDSPVGIAFNIPDGWTRTKPKSTMRIAELHPPRVDGDKSDSTLAVSFLGGGGDFESNVARWLGQVTAADGGAVDRDQAKISEIKVGNATLKILEVEGTIDDINPMTMQIAGKIKDGKFIVAMLQANGGAYFFKLTGSKKTVDAGRTAFDGLLQSIKLK